MLQRAELPVAGLKVSVGFVKVMDNAGRFWSVTVVMRFVFRSQKNSRYIYARGYV